jgi:hypothetical protein
MKKEWIMTDEEKKIKKQKIEQNRLKRTSSESIPTGNSEEGEVSPAPKIPAVGLDLPSKEQAIVLPPKQPMMPHNNNSISSGDRNQNSGFPSIGSLSRPSSPDHPSLDVSRIPTVVQLHCLENRDKVEVLYQQHHIHNGQQQSLHPDHQQLHHHRHPSSLVDVPCSPGNSTGVWYENSENSTTRGFVSKAIHPQPHHQPPYYSHADNSTGNPSPMSSPGSVSGRQVVQQYQSSTHSHGEEDQYPPQMPLLASLIRPGVSESPPEVLAGGKSKKNHSDIQK